VSDALYVYLQSVQAYIAPPIFAVFFLGVSVKRINGPGCMAGLVGGFVLGMARLAAEICKDSLQGTFLHGFADINFLYFCIILFVVSVVMIVLVSLLTARPSDEKLQGLTYATLSAEQKKKTRGSWTKFDVIHSCVVVGLIVVIYCYFNG